MLRTYKLFTFSLFMLFVTYIGTLTYIYSLKENEGKELPAYKISIYSKPIKFLLKVIIVLVFVGVLLLISFRIIKKLG